jgi:hypothetical protein
MAHHVGWGMAAAMLGVIVGCGDTARRAWDRSRPPVTDRIQAAYEDAASGRFLIIADFESVEQGQIFRIENVLQVGVTKISIRRSRQATGAGALEATFNRASDVLVCDNRNARDWSLIRDWSDYHLLLVSVYAPRDGVALQLEVGSGDTVVAHRFDHNGIPLTVGWNLLRIDLADLAERVQLNDVRSLGFTCVELTEPVTLYFDDFILTDNARDLLGSAEGAPGSLYARRQGRRIHVAAVGRFEVAFSQGRIAQWFDLAADPKRTEDLTGRGSLGPVPVVVASDPPTPTAVVGPDDEASWRRLGDAVRVRQQLLEASPVRVVALAEWFFLRPGTEADASTPVHRIIYTIYPQGRIFTDVQCATASDTWRAENVGLRFSTDPNRGFSAFRHAAGSADELSYLLHARSEPRQADLLFVLHDPRQGSVVRGVDSPQDPRLHTLVMGGEPEVPVTRFRGLLALWPADLHASGSVEPIAVDYCRPAALAPAAGETVETADGDLDHDGFDEASGCYVLRLVSDVCRFEIDGRKQVRFYPTFKLDGSADRDVWVYEAGRQLTNQARDADGNVIFQVDRIVNERVLIEVHAGPRSQ